MSEQLTWSEEVRRNRAVVNAMRACLGMGPLYNRTEAPEHLWLSMQTQIYLESRQGMTQRKHASR